MKNPAFGWAFLVISWDKAKKGSKMTTGRDAIYERTPPILGYILKTDYSKQNYDIFTVNLDGLSNFERENSFSCFPSKFSLFSIWRLLSACTKCAWVASALQA